MKIKDITQKTDKELITLVDDSRKQLAQLAIDYRTKQVGNVKQMAVVKRTIARALTIQRQRELSKEENHG